MHLANATSFCWREKQLQKDSEAHGAPSYSLFCAVAPLSFCICPTPRIRWPAARN